MTSAVVVAHPVVFPKVTAGILDIAQAVRGRYLDLADAMNVAFAAQFHTNAALTLDRRDFRAIHPHTDHRTIRLLPDDG
jgi:predicted nucleic acid-binding protein